LYRKSKTLIYIKQCHAGLRLEEWRAAQKPGTAVQEEQEDAKSSWSLDCRDDNLEKEGECCAPECSRIGWCGRSILSIDHDWKFAEGRSRFEVWTEERRSYRGNESLTASFAGIERVLKERNFLKRIKRNIVCYRCVIKVPFFSRKRVAYSRKSARCPRSRSSFIRTQQY